MSLTIWVVESRRMMEISIGDILTGQFLVRKIASLKSLGRLMKVCVMGMPEYVILVDHDGRMKDEVRNAKMRPWASIPIILVDVDVQNTGNWSGLEQLNARFVSYRNPFAFLQEIKNMLGENLDRSCGRQEFKDLVLDEESLQFFLQPGNRVLDLTLKEFQILRCLFKNASDYVAREDIHSHVWGSLHVSKRAVDSYVSKIRAKLKSTDIIIQNRYGLGYSLW